MSEPAHAARAPPPGAWSTRKDARLVRRTRGGWRALAFLLSETAPGDVMVVETAYPFTMQNADSSPNLLGPDTQSEGYPATPAGQRRYLIDLTRIVLGNGGVGTVYWKPAWVVSRCRTRWGTGSGWDNAPMFDSSRGNEVLPGFDYLHEDYSRR